VVTPPVVDPPVSGGGSEIPVVPPTVVVPPIVVAPVVVPPIVLIPGGKATQTPAITAPFSFVTSLSRSGEILGTVAIYSGTGTITAWRVVNFGDREYLELTLGW
jgi:hypothetical protein